MGSKVLYSIYTSVFKVRRVSEALQAKKAKLGR